MSIALSSETITELEFSPEWDRTFLRASSLLAEPACKAFELFRFRMVAPLNLQTFDSYPTMLQEVSYRIGLFSMAFFGALAVLTWPGPILFSAVVYGCAIKVLRAIGVALQTDGFTYIRGSAPEKPTGPVNVMTWNICGVGGGLHYDHGGVISWRSRLDQIVETIRREDPDVLVLEEIYDTELGEALQDRLGPSYAHFFTHLGPNVWGSEGGLLVAAKHPIAHFSHTPFENNDWTLNRGFASLELKNSFGKPCLRVIGTHLTHNSQGKRQQQIDQIIQAVDGSPKMPTVIVGDLNIERDGEEGKILTPYFVHGYLGDQPTCTNRLVEEWTGQGAPDETIDFISTLRACPARIEDCKASDLVLDTRTALSDHAFLRAKVRI